jgi:phage shock protein E
MVRQPAPCDIAGEPTNTAMKHVIVLFIVLLVASCTSSQKDAQRGADTAVAGATTSVAGSAVYVDVRTPEEYAEGHVVGAINIPHDQMAARWSELDAYKGKPMVVYCRSGRRSAIALEVLREHGFTAAENGGGLDDLRAKGVAVE